jgi:hypothetical protein
MARKVRDDRNFNAIAAAYTKRTGKACTADDVRNFFRAWRDVRDAGVAADLAELEQLRAEKRERELGLQKSHGGDMTTFVKPQK